MVSTDQDARLRFLEQASEVLTVASPAVSSFLRATKRDATAVQEIETTGADNSCSACSRPLLVGWSCEPVRSKEHRQTRQQRLSGATTTTKCVQCLACGTESTISHHKRPKTTKRQSTQTENTKPALKPATAKKDPEPIPISTPDSAPAPAPPSKEQTPEITQAKPAARRKARGKHASLQALVANKKPEAPKSSGFGLDFMDFMK